jgi:hypothetical protein
MYFESRKGGISSHRSCGGCSKVVTSQSKFINYARRSKDGAMNMTFAFPGTSASEDGVTAGKGRLRSKTATKPRAKPEVTGW